VATIPDAAVIDAAAAISRQLLDNLAPGDRARRWQEEAGDYQKAAHAGLLAALPHMQSSGISGIHERLIYGLRLGSLGSYSFAILAVVLAMFARVALAPLTDQFPYLTYMPAVFLAAFYCGTGPGLLAAFLGGFFNWLFFIPSEAAWDVVRLAQGRGLIPYLIIASFAAVTIGSLRNALDRERQAEMRQAILIGELQHRTRNLLSIVRVLSEKSVSSSESLDDFDREFARKLGALGHAQKMLWTDKPLGLLELVRAELKAHGADELESRITIRGPAVMIVSHPMRYLALAIHELATNSLKYGALAQSSASLSITWQLDKNDVENLVFQWVEQDVRMPDHRATHQGFGRQLIERALPSEVSGWSIFKLNRDGMRCAIQMPVGSSG